MSRLFLIIWSTLMGATLAWMLWPDSQKGSGESLASIKKRNGTVQIRRSGTFNWTDVKAGTPLYALDSIATESSSRAVLLLSDGTEILLPPDTQLKIQPQSLSQGVEIAVLKGGVAVQKAKEVRIKSNKDRERAPPKATPLAITTARYKIDLSTLEGTFRLGSDAAVQAENPNTVVLKGEQDTLNLAELEKEGDQVLDGSESNSIFEIDELPVPKPAVVAEPPPPPPPPPPKPKPMKLTAKPSEKAPEPLAVIEDPDPELVFPEWKTRGGHFWINAPLSQSGDRPIALPVVWEMKDQVDKWETIFRIGIANKEQKLLIRRRITEQGFVFNLKEIRRLLGASNADHYAFSIQAGLVKKTQEGKVARFAPDKIDIELHSLRYRQPFTLTLDALPYAESDGHWFKATAARESKIVLHVINPRRMLELEGFLRGSQSFTITPMTAVPSGAVFGMVKGPELDLVSENLAPEEIKVLSEALKLDLVFKGPAAAYLGGKGQFDLMGYLDKSSDAYYIRRGLSLKLDSQLFKTQAAARDFIRKFDPYFFNQTVDIIYAR